MGDFDFIAEKVKAFKDAEEAKKAKAEEEKATLQARIAKNEDLVENCIRKVIFPVLHEAKKALVSSGVKAEADTIVYTDAATGKQKYTGANLQIITGKRGKVNSSTDSVNGPLLSFHGGFGANTVITSKIEVWEKEPKELSVIEAESNEVTADIVKEQIKRLVDYAFREQ